MHAQCKRKHAGREKAGLGVIFAGAAERGRLATTFNPPLNRPSEHSGENHTEFADDPTKTQSWMAVVPKAIANWAADSS